MLSTTPVIRTYERSLLSTPNTTRKMALSAELDVAAKVRSTKDELVKHHNAQVERLQRQQNSKVASRSVKRPDLDNPYPASVKSISELEKIPLRTLEQGKHHRRKVLVLRIVALPYSGIGTVTVVEDEYGDVERLVIFAHSDSSILSNIPEGCFVAVKEPFYRCPPAGQDVYPESKTPVISVDHPSDILLLRFSDPIIPLGLKGGVEHPLLSSLEEWKTAGDTAFLEGDLATAAFCYTEALDFVGAPGENESMDSEAAAAAVYTKRAGTNLLLGKHDAARSDALASLTGGSADWRGHLTAAKAAYALRDFGGALEQLDLALALHPSDSATVTLNKERARTLDRIHEEDTGEYDFPALAASVSPAGPKPSVHLDVADFTRRTTVEESPMHGRGLFATELIPAGELVFVEKATVMPTKYDDEGSAAGLYAGMVRRMYDSPTVAARIGGCWAGEYGCLTGKEGTVVDGTPVIDVFHTELVRTKNCHSCPPLTVDNTRPRPEGVPEPPQTRGIWPHAAIMNHACVANSTRAFCGDLFITRASRDIPAGDEITQQYVPVRADWGERQAQLRHWWGFECACALCAAERPAATADPATGGAGGAHARRKALLAQIEKLANRAKPAPGRSSTGLTADRRQPPPGIYPDATIRNVERLSKQLEDAHEREVYGEGGAEGGSRLLPRLMLVFPHMWLIDAYRGRRNHAKVIQKALGVIRDFGFLLPPSAVSQAAATADGLVEGIEIQGLFQTQPSEAAGLMTIHVLRALKHGADAHQALGREEEAERWEAAAAFGFKMVSGWENDIDIMMAPAEK
ncbi:hypothetical protein RB601_003089 [Gaeumannomyces tritici]